MLNAASVVPFSGTAGRSSSSGGTVLSELKGQIGRIKSMEHNELLDRLRTVRERRTLTAAAEGLGIRAIRDILIANL